MQLEPRTEELVRSFFRGHVCWRCGQPAMRYLRRHFYCDQHIPHGRGPVEENRRVHRLHWPSHRGW